MIALPWRLFICLQGCQKLHLCFYAPPFDGCDNLKAIYVPEKNVEYYKKRLPSKMHWLIVEEGSELPVKAENFTAKDITFSPTLRVIVPNCETDMLAAVKRELRSWTKDKIIEWVTEHINQR